MAAVRLRCATGVSDEDEAGDVLEFFKRYELIDRSQLSSLTIKAFDDDELQVVPR